MLKPKMAGNTVWEKEWGDLIRALDTRGEPRSTEQGEANLSCLIEEPPGKRIRARRVVKRSNARCTFKVPCWTARRMIHCESELERDGVLLLDAAPFVTDIAEQPAKISVVGDGVDYVHFPDTLVAYHQRKVFVEFKESVEANRPEIGARSRVMRTALAARGFGYCVLTEDVIRRQPRLDNVKQLLRCGRADLGLAEREGVRRWLVEGDRERTWGDLLGMAPHSMLPAQVCRLVLEGAAGLPLLENWTRKTPISIR